MRLRKKDRRKRHACQDGAHPGQESFYQSAYRATRLPGNGAQPWTYAGIEGALFRGASGMTVIVQNATPDARSTDLTQLAGGVPPSEVETISMPDLAVTPLLPALVTGLAPALDMTLPSYSVTRLTWTSSPHRVRRHLPE